MLSVRLIHTHDWIDWQLPLKEGYEPTYICWCGRLRWHNYEWYGKRAAIAEDYFKIKLGIN